MINESKTKIEKGLFNDTSRYADIMAQPHPNPKAHLRMNRGDRAAQFAPFAALTGYQELINEKTKHYAHKRYPSAEQAAMITAELRRLPVDQQPVVTLNYFNAEAGFYQSTTAMLLKINWKQGVVNLAGPLTIAIANIRRIEAGKY